MFDIYIVGQKQFDHACYAFLLCKLFYCLHAEKLFNGRIHCYSVPHLMLNDL